MNQTSIKDIYLKTPDLSDESIIGYNTGIRPFRKKGVRIEIERTATKCIIHNYGYGGSGLTLCWGGAAEILKYVSQEKPKRIAILGAGVIGMACAYELKAKGYDVTMYADTFTPDLTSNVAAGIFSYPVIHGGEDEKQLQLLGSLFDISAQRFQASLINPEFAGVRLIDDFIFDENSAGHHVIINEYKCIARESTQVHVHFDNGNTKPATLKKVFGLDGKIFINDLFEKVKVNGVKIIKQHFKSREEVEALPEDVIVNCTSMGSQELFGDDDFLPIRGQLVYFRPQAGVNYSTYQGTEDANYWVKIYPWHDRLILNGVFEFGKKEKILDKAVVARMLGFARACFYG